MYHNVFISSKTIRLGQGDLLGRPGRGTLVLEGTPDDISEVRLKGPAVKVMEGDFLI
jgi:predicted PhzF superfamily epimerase YddE/YHI9